MECNIIKNDLNIPNLKKHFKKNKKNDKLKKELALKNNVKEENYIIIDCRESDLEYIKNNISKSRLAKLFDLNQIDWIKVEKSMCNSLIKKTCELKHNNTDMTTTEISEIMKIGKNPITRYLKIGNKIGWCEYSVREEKKKGSSKAGKSSGKAVEIFKNNESLGVFPSCHELDRKSNELFGVKLIFTNISATCNGQYKQYKGFNFKYV